MARNITPRADDYSQWYLDIIKAAELADYAPVRGCMVIRPTGYSLWESIQHHFDEAFKIRGIYAVVVKRFTHKTLLLSACKKTHQPLEHPKRIGGVHSCQYAGKSLYFLFSRVPVIPI